MPAATSADGTMVVAIDGETVLSWRTTDKKHTAAAELDLAHGAMVIGDYPALAFHPDGSMVAVIGESGVIIIPTGALGLDEQAS